MWIRNLALLGCLCCTLPLAASEFPLCLYGVSDPADLKLVKKAGFSCVQTYQADPQKLEILAQVAQKYNLKVVFYPNQVIGSAYAQKAQQWPMLAWYLVDEPDVHRWSRERVEEVKQKANKAFPNHLTTLVIGQGKTQEPYYDIPDAMMVDWYPVPHLPLTSFGDNVAWTKQGMMQYNAGDRPLWGVVQIFDWKDYKQYRPDNDRIGRLPTQEEMRFMSYHGILSGATGLFFYTFAPQKQPLPQKNAQHWKQVKKVVQELAKFKKILENATPADNPVDIKAPFMMKTWKYKKHLYSVLLNTSDTAQPLPAELADHSFKTLYHHKKTPQVPPYQVLILKHR